MTTNIVEQLLRGSENIDRMKKEVECVVRMVIGFANRRVSLWQDFEVEFDSPTCLWKVQRTEYSNTLEVECHLHKSYGLCSVYTNTTHFTSFFHLEEVQVVWQDLSTFVEGMATTLPALNEDWKPLLDAADKFSPTK